MKPSRSPFAFAMSPLAIRGAAAVAALAAVLGASPAFARSYQGYGDTGWNHYNKRDCCEDAAWLAQDNSVYLCESAGGRASVPSGSARGLCSWEAHGSGYDRVYRCTSKTSVNCR